MRVYSATDVGQKRKMNQDYVFVSENPVGNLPNLFVVADGMGGHNAGDYASSHAVQTLVDEIRRDADFNPIKVIRHAIETANTEILERSRREEHLRGMGTTIVVCTVVGHYAYVANVGDSRLYLVRDRIRQVTRDHSYVEELVSLGRLERGSKDYKDKKNIITRAVGTEDKLLVDFFEVGLEPGDYILMCSDGLSNMLEDAEMEEIIGSDLELQEKAEKLITVANDNGGKDNIAVVLVDPQIGREGSL